MKSITLLSLIVFSSMRAADYAGDPEESIAPNAAMIRYIHDKGRWFWSCTHDMADYAKRHYADVIPITRRSFISRHPEGLDVLVRGTKVRKHFIYTLRFHENIEYIVDNLYEVTHQFIIDLAMRHHMMPYGETMRDCIGHVCSLRDVAELLVIQGDYEELHPLVRATEVQKLVHAVLQEKIQQASGF